MKQRDYETRDPIDPIDVRRDELAELERTILEFHSPLWSVLQELVDALDAGKTVVVEVRA